MQLFYSGAFAPGRAQPDPALSLGGNISATPLRNGADGSVFPAITSDQVANNYPDVRLLVLTNITGADVSAINIYTVRGTYATYKLAAVAPAINSCGDKVFEKILDGHSLPFQATLAAHEGSGQAIVISTIANGASIGLWIERDLDLTAFTQLDGAAGTPFDQFDMSPTTDPTSHGCAKLVEELQAEASASITPEEFQLVISWT